MKPPPIAVRRSERVNSLHAFASEDSSRSEAPLADLDKQPASELLTLARFTFGRWLVIIGAVVLVSGTAVWALRGFSMPTFTRAPQTATLTLETRPPGSDVLIDGEKRGTTPLTLALIPGPHTVTIRNGSDSRVVPLTIAAGADVTQSFEMRSAEPAVVGGLSVVTDPPGAPVTVDGQSRGVSPLTVADLTAGQHKVVVTGEAGAAERTVSVTAGGTSSVMFSLPRLNGPVGGWLSIAAPFDIEVIERDDVIGAAGMTRIMLASGRHDIVMRNSVLGYADARTINVAAGKTTSIRIDAPKVPVSVNARPWAEITVDGDNVGQTPIANLALAIGSHEVVFRHPQFAERKQTVMVTAQGPNRITADLTK